MSKPKDWPWPERRVSFDGVDLEPGDVMTLRVALNNFLMWLGEDGVADSLGVLAQHYRQRASAMLIHLSVPIPKPSED